MGELLFSAEVLCLSVSAGSGQARSWATGVEVCERRGEQEFIRRLPLGPVKRGNAGIGGLRRGSGAEQGYYCGFPWCQTGPSAAEALRS